MPRLRVVFHPLAAREIERQLAYYGDRNLSAKESLKEEIKSAIDRIQSAPERYEHTVVGARRFLLKRFPMSLIYVVEPDRIRVLALAHAKRRSHYWRRRK